MVVAASAAWTGGDCCTARFTPCFVTELHQTQLLKQTSTEPGRRRTTIWTTPPCPDNTLRIEGELTIYTAAAIKQQLDQLLGRSAELEIELSQVSEMDTAGLQLLILAKRECLARSTRAESWWGIQTGPRNHGFVQYGQLFRRPVVIPGNAG